MRMSLLLAAMDESNLVLLGIDARPIEEFEEGDSQRQHQPADENVEDTGHVA